MGRTKKIEARNASAEASAVADNRARVLEPSPPAVATGPWYADDPVADLGSGVLAPDGVGTDADTVWSQWLADNPTQSEWAAERWLSDSRRLPPVPPTLVETRLALHRLATYVIAPIRHQANGKFGLRWTLGGFGTPFFGNDRQVRVVGNQLVDQSAGEIRTTPITTLTAAADFLGATIDAKTAAEHDSPPVGDVDEQLAVDIAAADFLGNWFGMGFAALEAARADSASVDASRPQLWPGHFDPAIEIGDEDHRGSYGASPGDVSIAEPYLYVSIWWPDRMSLDTSDPAWNAPSFTGAVLRLSEFPEGDPAAAAANFFVASRDRMTSS